MSVTEIDYGSALLEGFEYLLSNHPEVFVIGQGLWSPWYVGNSMTDLDKKFGTARIIDTPVSESACTGAAVGAALCGMKSIVVHPRMDFMMYAMDAIVNQAAKWSTMVGGQARPNVTVRGTINRGGEQGAQHSQSLHSWFAHIPGLRVVMPSTVKDARDLLIASVLCPDPVIFIDDRWLYDLTDVLEPYDGVSLADIGPNVLVEGNDLTIAASGYSTRLAQEASKTLADQGVSAEIIDTRVLNPFDPDVLIESVEKTGRLLVVDGGWSTCGFAGEVIASVSERISPRSWKSAPKRVTLPPAPAPTSSVLELLYYPDTKLVVATAMAMV